MVDGSRVNSYRGDGGNGDPGDSRNSNGVGVVRYGNGSLHVLNNRVDDGVGVTFDGAVGEVASEPIRFDNSTVEAWDAYDGSSEGKNYSRNGGQDGTSEDDSLKMII